MTAVVRNGPRSQVGIDFLLEGNAKWITGGKQKTAKTNLMILYHHVHVR